MSKDLNYNKELETIFKFTYDKLMLNLRAEFLDNIKLNNLVTLPIPANVAKDFFKDRIIKEVNIKVVKVPILLRFVIEETGEVNFKAQTVLNVVRHMMKEESISLQLLEHRFNPKLHGLKYFAKKIEDIKAKDKVQPRRYFDRENELLYTSDNEKIAISKNWSHNFDSFIISASRYGYTIKEYTHE